MDQDFEKEFADIKNKMVKIVSDHLYNNHNQFGNIIIEIMKQYNQFVEENENDIRGFNGMAIYLEFIALYLPFFYSEIVASNIKSTCMHPFYGDELYINSLEVCDRKYETFKAIMPDIFNNVLYVSNKMLNDRKPRILEKLIAAQEERYGKVKPE